MRRRPLQLLLVVALLAGGLVATVAAPAVAATTTVSTDDQLWVNQSAPSSTNCTLWSSVNGSTTAGKRTVVSFNTNGVIPAGNAVTAVTLRVYARNNYSGNTCWSRGTSAVQRAAT